MWECSIRSVVKAGLTLKNWQSLLPALRQLEHPWPSPESPLHLIFLFRHRRHLIAGLDYEKFRKVSEYLLPLEHDVFGSCAFCHPPLQSDSYKIDPLNCAGPCFSQNETLKGHHDGTGQTQFYPHRRSSLLEVVSQIKSLGKVLCYAYQKGTKMRRRKGL